MDSEKNTPEMDEELDNIIILNDEDGKEITNKFGYFKTSIETNFRKLNSLNEELYPEDDNSSFWDDYKFIDKEGR